MIPRQPAHVAGYIDCIEHLRPLVVPGRAGFDRDRRLPDDIFQALAGAGLFDLWLPRSYGGPELSPLDFMEIVEAASTLDGSIGWIVGNGAGMSRSAGNLPVDGAREIWSKGPVFVASSTSAQGTARPVQGGYRVSGRWPFGSGIQHAKWAMGLCAIDDDVQTAPPSLISCYLSVPDLDVIDTWHVSGMRATGSADFVAKDIFVPGHRTHAFPPTSFPEPGLLYRMPVLSIFPWTVSVVPLGIAQAALAAFREVASARTRLGTTLPLRERELIQSEFGRAEAQWRAGRAILIDAMNDLMRATDCGGERLVHSRAIYRTACTFAAESAVAIVDRLSAAAGSIAIREDCLLERCVRDVHAAVKHIAMTPNAYVIAGRVGLGLDPGTARF